MMQYGSQHIYQSVPRMLTLWLVGSHVHTHKSDIEALLALCIS